MLLIGRTCKLSSDEGCRPGVCCGHGYATVLRVHDSPVVVYRPHQASVADGTRILSVFRVETTTGGGSGRTGSDACDNSFRGFEGGAAMGKYRDFPVPSSHRLPSPRHTLPPSSLPPPAPYPPNLTRSVFDVIFQAVWTLERLVQWHVQSSIGNDVVHPQSPEAASFALPDVIDAVVKEIPALVSVMSAEPELSLPVTKVLSNAARLDGSTRVFRKVMTCVSPSGREHVDYASLPSSGNLSPSPFVRLTCTPVASTDSSMAGRKKDADLAAERERVGESMPSPSLSQSEVRGGVDAICVMLSQLQLQSQAEASNEADGDHVKRKNGHSECLAFATQCVSAISDPSLALDSEKGALVLEDIHKHGVSMASARHVQHLAGDRYWEFPTWLEGVWEEEDDKHPAAMDTPLENLSDDPVARHEMKLLTQAWL